MSFRRIAAAAAALSYAFLPAGARAVETAPLTATPGGLYSVQASVDGRPPVAMLLDLGAGIDMLSAGLGGQVVFGVDRAYTAWSPTGERRDMPMGSVVSLALGEYSLADNTVGIWKGLDGSGFDGAISAMAFKDVVTTFDFKNRQLVVEDAPSFAERKRSATYVPFVVVDDRSIGLRIFAPFDFGGRTGLCLVDTGITGIAVNRQFAASMHQPVASIALHAAPQIALANPPIAIENLVYDCDVGLAFWANRALTIDIPNRAMFVGSPT